MRITIDTYRRLAAAKMFIDGHYHRPISLAQVARQACLSRFHFHRLFCRVYQRTPHRYITQCRLEAAKTLLANGLLPIADICGQVGFESPGSFSSLFRKHCGQPPLHYRQAALYKKSLVQEQPLRLVPHCFVEQFRLGTGP